MIYRSCKTLVMNTSLFLVTSVLLVIAASAQRGPGEGRFRLDPEQQEAVWKIQVYSVVKDQAIEKDAAEKLLAAYKATREKLNEAFESARGEGGGDWRERFEKMNELRTKEREAFGAAIGEFLNEDQTKKAVEVLGSFGRFWDTLTQRLSEIVKEEDLLLQAAFTVGSHLAQMESGSPGGDREARRERFREAQEKLDEALSKILTEEQMTQWKESAGFRRGQR